MLKDIKLNFKTFFCVNKQKSVNNNQRPFGRNSMKQFVLIFIAAILCVSAFCDERWSNDFVLDGNQITEKAIVLNPTDSIAYSTDLAAGNPRSLTVTVEDKDDPAKKVCLFSDNSGKAVEGTITWNYNDEIFKDFPVDDTYLVKQTVTTDLESLVLTRSVTLMPEPAAALALAVVGVLFLRKRVKKLAAVLSIAALASFSAKAENVVSDVNCLQMWPFDNRVAVNYTLDGEKEDSVYEIKLFGSVDDCKTIFELSEQGTLIGEGADGTVTGSGKYKVFWTPNNSFNRKNFKNAKIKVQAMERCPNSYMVIDLSGGTNASKFAVSYLDSVPKGGWTEEYKTTKLVLRLLPAGKFIMGSPEYELGREQYILYEVQREVTLTKPFYAGVFEVTQKQYELVTGKNPSAFKGDARPVESVSYDMIRGAKEGGKWPASGNVDEDSFMGILRAKTNLDFDLPTDAQWEYACRAGMPTALNNGKNLSSSCYCGNLDKLARNKYNLDDGKGGYSGQHTTVGSYLPNAWGLYDMHGNACEWVLDWSLYDNVEFYSSAPVTDPKGGRSGTARVRRGGDYGSVAHMCRSAATGCSGPNDACYYDGFRVALTVGEDLTQTFEYSIESVSINTLPVFSAKFYGTSEDGTEYLLEDIGSLSGEGSSGIVFGKGTHKICWTPDCDHKNLVGKLKFSVKYENITSDAKYLVLDLNNYKMRTALQGPMEDANIWSNDACRTSEIWFRRIEPGTFIMGSPESEIGRSHNETQHNVTLSRAYYIGVFETTQKQYKMIMDQNYSIYCGETRPVDSVSYDMLRGADEGKAWPANNNVDNNSFFGILRDLVGNTFDLPTEAQWEYACRAGSNTSWNNGNNITNVYEDGCLNNLGRYKRNGGGDKNEKNRFCAHAAVGSYAPNAWGLYDMHGNVYEKCLDWFGYYNEDPVTDPKGPDSSLSSNPERVVKGGYWLNEAYECRSASRRPSYTGSESESTGFRIVLF